MLEPEINADRLPLIRQAIDILSANSYGGSILNEESRKALEELIPKFSSRERREIVAGALRGMTNAMLSDREINFWDWSESLRVIDRLQVSDSEILGFRKLVVSLTNLFSGGARDAKPAFELAVDAYRCGMNLSSSTQKAELIRTSLLVQQMIAPLLATSHTEDPNPAIEAMDGILSRIRSHSKEPRIVALEPDATLARVRSLLRFGSFQSAESELRFAEIAFPQEKQKFREFREETEHSAPIAGEIIAGMKGFLTRQPFTPFIEISLGSAALNPLRGCEISCNFAWVTKTKRSQNILRPIGGDKKTPGALLRTEVQIIHELLSSALKLP